MTTKQLVQKARRDRANHLLARAKARASLVAAIQRLTAEGVSRRQVAKQLGVAINTVQDVVNAR